MFWDTQVMQNALNLAEKHIGPNNQYVEASLQNAFLYTKEAGKFWYGDIELDDSGMGSAGLQSLANELKETVYVVMEDAVNHNMQRKIKKFEDLALIEINPRGEKN